MKISPDRKTDGSPSAVRDIAGRLEEGKRTVVTGLRGSSPSFVLASIFGILRKTVLYVTATEEEAREAKESLSLFLGAADVLHFPPWDRFATSVQAVGGDVPSRRIEVLVRLLAGGPAVVVASLEALLSRVAPRKAVEGYVETLFLGDRRDRDGLAAKLQEGGYRRVPLVEREGEFSVRGNIVDFHWTGGEKPFRIEFSGDEIESIRTFDPATQRSKEEQLEAPLRPVTEFLRTGLSLREAMKNLRLRSNELGLSREERERLAERLEGGADMAPIPWLLPLFFASGDSAGGLDTLFDYLPVRTPLFLDSLPLVRAAGGKLENDLERFLYRAREEGRYFPEKDTFWISPAEWEGIPAGRAVVEFSRTDTGEGETVAFETEMPEGLKGTGSVRSEADRGLLSPLAERVQSWVREEFQVFFVCGEDETDRMVHLFSQYDLPAGTSKGSLLGDVGEPGLLPGRLLVKTGRIREGFVAPALRIAVISETEVFGEKIRRRRGRSRREGFFLKSFAELSPGDFLVHKDHGIGIYRGLERIRFDSRENDFLLIEYHGNDKLFIPVDRLDQIQRYVGPEGHRPGVDRLGGTS
ncbi:MAG TPA: CarD family transcriptional regulator, partial [Syntrophales bacterium]|nr:CarD family transcriptional regulator [Syntrophales bacterium]